MSATGVVQAARLLARFLDRTDLLLAPRAGRGHVLARQIVPGLLIGAMVLSPLPMTWKTYWLTQTNDWTGLCAYLQHHIRSDDRLTGDEYFEEIAVWCFNGRPVQWIEPPDGATLGRLSESGREVWYVHIGSDAAAGSFTSYGYSPIPRSAWDPSGPLAPGQASGRLRFRQEEQPASLYRHPSGAIRETVTFHDLPGSGSTPDFAHVVPGQDYTVRLSLPATAPRTLRLVYFDLVGRDLDVVVNGVLLTHITAGASGGQWVPLDLPLPADAGDVVRVELHNPATQPEYVSAFAEVELRYACPAAPDTGCPRK